MTGFLMTIGLISFLGMGVSIIAVLKNLIQRRRKKVRQWFYSLALFFVVFIVSAIVSAGADPESESQVTSMDATAVVPTETPTQSPTENLLSLAKSTLEKNSNRGIPKITSAMMSVIDDGSTLAQVEFAISEHTFQGTTNRTARKDIVALLEAIFKSSLDYDGVNILGSYSLEDLYGNSNERIVVRLFYEKDNLSRIQWDNFDSENVYEISDDQAIHKSFR